jgi:hypothetical protein
LPLFINFGKMRFIQSTLLFAAAAAVADAAKEFVDISELDQVAIWNKFQSAFGASRVQSSFSSPGSLVSAIAAEDESATQVGCSVSYAYGADLGNVSTCCVRLLYLKWN